MKIYIFVVEDSWGNQEEVAVTDPIEDDVFLSLLDSDGDVQNFEAEACHLREWAESQEFKISKHVLELDLVNRQVESWKEGRTH